MISPFWEMLVIRSKIAGVGYWGVQPKVVLGVWLDGRASGGDVPFYALPYLDIRGIRALRYQDETVVMGELEVRWNVYKRWSLIGFMRLGHTAKDFGKLGEASNRHTVGGGARYYIARRLGLHTGIDIARGPAMSPLFAIPLLPEHCKYTGSPRGIRGAGWRTYASEKDNGIHRGAQYYAGACHPGFY